MHPIPLLSYLPTGNDDSPAEEDIEDDADIE